MAIWRAIHSFRGPSHAIIEPPAKQAVTLRERLARAYRELLLGWLALLLRHRGPATVALLFATALLGWYAAANFQVDSSTGDLIRQEAPWRVNQDRFQAAFPNQSSALLVALSGDDRDTLLAAAGMMRQRLLREPGIDWVSSPPDTAFFQKHALWYMPLAEPERLVADLQPLRPLVGQLAEDRSLPVVLGILQARLEVGETLAPLAELVTRAGEAALARERYVPPAPNLSLPGAGGQSMLVLQVHAVQDHAASLPNRLLLAAAEAAAWQLAQVGAFSGVDVLLSGEPALDHDEISAAQRGAGIAGSVSLLALIAVLSLGVRSLRTVLAVYATVLLGLLWTVAWALFSVGSFNPISIVFLVMFIGLGVDFAIHFVLRVQEEQAAHQQRDDIGAALAAALSGSGGAISLCALSSGLAFLAFLPTDYRGLADMGVISAGGMAIALCLSFTVIPLLFAWSAPSQRWPVRYGDVTGGLARRFRWPIVIAALALLAVSVQHARDMPFDYSTLALKDPDFPSMRALEEMQAQGVATNYALSVLVDSRAEARPLARQLAALDAVSEVRWLDDYLPADVQARRELIADLDWVRQAADAMGRGATASNREYRFGMVHRLRESLAGVEDPAWDPLAAVAGRAAESLYRHQVLARWEEVLAAAIPQRLQHLEALVAAPEPTRERLPLGLREAYIGKGDVEQLRVIPAGNLANLDELAQFNREVLAVAPNASGRSIAEAGVGEVVVGAFFEAVTIAVVVVGLLLWLTLGSLRDTALVFFPLLLALAMTLAAARLLGEPLNMANIIVVPLIFGLGVDNGIHIVQRYRESGALDHAVRSSTPRAVLLSSLTTLATFSSLMLSPHRGMFSIGALLTLAILFLLFSTLVVLPALLALARQTRV